MTSQFTVSRHVIGDTIGNDTIVINVNSGDYYSLTAEAGVVWAAVQEGNPLSAREVELATVLVRETILSSDQSLDSVSVSDEEVFIKYTDMSEILLADPIHEVDEDGWPRLK